MRFTIKRDDDRYNHGAILGVNANRLAGGEFPAEFVVEGMTIEQAQELCDRLSNYDAGCDNLFYIVEDQQW